MNQKPAPSEGQSSEQTASLATSDDAACSPSCSALRENAACKAALQSLSACCYGQNLTQSVAGADALVRAYREADQKLRSENERLCGIVRKFVEDYLKIPWGNDGDCGSTRLVNTLDCEINESPEND